MAKRSIKFTSLFFIYLTCLASTFFAVVYLGFIDVRVWDVVSQNYLAVILFSVILLPSCFFIGDIFIKRNLQAFFHLSAFTQKVKDSKDYELRFEPSGGPEMVTLSQNINDMLETIHTGSELNRLNTKRLMEAQVNMSKMAHYDTLTGLPNRKYFMETLERALAQSKRNSKNIALIFFDLDGFRLVNDTYSHKIGDSLLVEVGARARNLLRQGDLLARLGGDEFLILLYNDPDEVTLNEIAKRLGAELSIPYNIDGWQLKVSASIGIAVASDSEFDIKEFISNVDIAMYRAKDIGPGNFEVFSPYMKEEKKRKLDIANALDTAIEQNEFQLVYQAKVDNKQNVVGYEALIRWNSETLGFVPPDEFIQIAENCAKISLITFWVLERLCLDIKTFTKKHGADIKISFNLSAHDLKDSNLSKKIGALLLHHQVDGRNLEIEVTESAYLENIEVANTFFDDMAKLNCSIALDDFGTGYSSLGYLTQINIDTLKIDKQFVDHVSKSSKSKLVTRAIIEMGKQLGLEICAEGVETAEQADFLIENGCHQLQGYLFGKPTALNQLFKIDNNI
jgi:diguanylate cyclase (GGDEF)-like protein